MNLTCFLMLHTLTWQGYERVIKPTLQGIANVLGAVNRALSVEKGGLAGGGCPGGGLPVRAMEERNGLGLVAPMLLAVRLSTPLVLSQHAAVLRRCPGREQGRKEGEARSFRGKEGQPTLGNLSAALALQSS